MNNFSYFDDTQSAEEGRNHMKMKRFLAMVVALLMVLQMMPLGVMAEGLTGLYSAPIQRSDGGIVTVTFLDNEGNNVTEDYLIEAGGSISPLPDAPDIEGFVFSGWYVGDAEVTTSTVFTSDTKVRAKYTQLFTVTFVYENDEGETVVQDQRQVEEGQAVGTLPADPVRAGYTFKGWYDEEDNQISAETVIGGEMTVSAQFTKGPEVSFYSEGNLFSKISLEEEGKNLLVDEIFDIMFKLRTSYRGMKNFMGSDTMLDLTEKQIMIYMLFQKLILMKKQNILIIKLIPVLLQLQVNV